MFTLIFALATRAATALFIVTRYLPGNLLIAWLRSRKGVKFGVPAMLLAFPYWWFGMWIESLIQNGALPGAFYLIVAACAFTMAKLFLMGPISLVLLIKTRWCEILARRRGSRLEQEQEAGEAERADDVPEKVEHHERSEASLAH
ncbi:sulfate permease [Leucobacter ruminantium]|uniref:Sulfate permease n=1 Tax=Leucobacter ruminantium TaxID=1289170 RepID=A0A939LY46_9MICO|nr:sulfate permease [Leucobacter ruminantium]MBO1804542.1 sulfate permease [Leucobacter ruminantium]